MNRLIAVIVAWLSMSFASSAEEIWSTGFTTRLWKDGRSCGMNDVCFDIYQPGRGLTGIFGTPDCWREQVWTTDITSFPPDVRTYQLQSASGHWRYGLQSVDFDQSSIKIKTFVVQDHGGPQNVCLAPGFGNFILKFHRQDEGG
jgi:hypothetical protein